MSRVPKVNWQPSADRKTLQARAALFANIRAYFASQAVLEVDTPLLSRAGNPDPHVQPMAMSLAGQTYYLQTSPEFPMKRLLAAQLGDIYQISKAFRLAEQGHRHNPEFTLLEWYRVGFDEQQLIDDVKRLLQQLGLQITLPIISYAALFQQYFDINPHTATAQQLAKIAEDLTITVPTTLDCDGWLSLLLTHVIEPDLIAKQSSCFVCDYPMSQAALAKVEQGVAKRFELYLHGIEVANGFYELTDATEQLKRFQQDNQARQAQGLAPVPIDTQLIAALAAGLPSCAGVALGIDRLLMHCLAKSSINDVLSFAWADA